MQVVTLCKALGYPKVNLVGTSGGAYAAINAALAAPELFNKVVADSFDGSKLAPGFSKALLQERQSAKGDRRGVFTNGARGKIGSGSSIWTRRRW